MKHFDGLEKQRFKLFSTKKRFWALPLLETSSG